MCEAANCKAIPEDFDWTIRIAWSDEANRVYFSVDVFDDIWPVPDQVGARGLHKWDDLELLTDPDNSGGHIGNVGDADGIVAQVDCLAASLF